MLEQSDPYNTITVYVRQEDLFTVNFELADGFHKCRHLEFYWFDESVTSSTWEQRREHLIFFYKCAKGMSEFPHVYNFSGHGWSLSFQFQFFQMNAASGCLKCFSLV